MMPRVWVTGAPGMLGKILVPHLERLGWKVTALSQTGRDGTVPLELSDSDKTSALFEREKPDAVINPAAYSDVDGCERDPGRAHAANALAVKHLARLCGRAGAPLIHVSTDYVFKGDQKAPYAESDPTFPVNVYGLTKLEGEIHAASCAAGGAIVRTSWLFGGPNPANFVNAILAKLRTEKEVSVLEDQTDSPTSVKDLSAALEKITLRCLEEKGKPVSVYHFCNKGETTRLGMTRRMQEWLKLPVSVKPAASIPNRPAIRPLCSVMSCARFEKDFRMTIRPWEEAAREYLTSPACAS